MSESDQQLFVLISRQHTQMSPMVPPQNRLSERNAAPRNSRESASFGADSRKNKTAMLTGRRPGPVPVQDIGASSIPPPTPAADRARRARKQRAYRARQRAGVAVLKVPTPEYDLVQALIEEGGPILYHSAAAGGTLPAPMVPKAEKF